MRATRGEEQSSLIAVDLEIGYSMNLPYFSNLRTFTQKSVLVFVDHMAAFDEK